jgi:hypothetical protein
LVGSALLTLAIGLVAYRMPRRRALLAAGFLMAATGLCFAGIEGFWPLLVIAFAGTLNPSGGDVGVFLPLEHTDLAQRLSHHAIRRVPPSSAPGALIEAAVAISQPVLRGTAVDDYFVIQPIGGLWVVVSSEIIVARCPTVPEAIKAAVQVASRTAGYGRRVQVLVDEPGGGRPVIWDSTRDGYSAA